MSKAAQFVDDVADVFVDRVMKLRMAQPVPAVQVPQRPIEKWGGEPPRDRYGNPVALFPVPKKCGLKYRLRDKQEATCDEVLVARRRWKEYLEQAHNNPNTVQLKYDKTEYAYYLHCALHGPSDDAIQAEIGPRAVVVAQKP